MLNDVVRLGPFIIKNLWIVLFFSGVISYIIMELRLRKYPELQNMLLPIVGNGLLITLLIYKLSIMVFRPSIILNNPKGILFFTGGTSGLLLGIVIGTIYLIIKVKKNVWNLRNALDVLVLGIIGMVSTYYILVVFLFT